MTDEHPNITLLKRIDLSDIAGSTDVFAEDVVFHYFNPVLPDIQGDYVGLAELQGFFGKLASLTHGTFKVNPVSTTLAGDELVVVHSKNTMILEDQQIETDVVVVWRFVDGRIAEVWDIPSVHGGAASRG